MTLITSTATASQAQPKKKLVTRQDWVYAFSLGSSSLWLSWGAVLGPVFAYTSPALIRPHVIALLIATVLIPLILVGLVALIRSLPPTPSRIGRTALVALILAHPLAILAVLLRDAVPTRFSVPGALLIDAVFVALWREELIAVGKTALRLVFPVSILTILVGVYVIFTAPGQQAEYAEFHNGRVNDSRHSPILWIIFDELDGDLAFGNYPQNRALKEFRKFRQQSLFLENAQAPNRATIRSIPALLTGTAINEATPVKGPDLSLDVEGLKDAVRLTRRSTVFDDVHRSGRRISLIGYYHPYCTLFEHSVDECYWTQWAAEGPWQWPLVGMKFGPIARELEVGVFPYLPLASSLRSNDMRDLHRAVIERIVAASKQSLSSGRCSFVLLHLPVPHPPFVFDGKARSFSETGGSYWGNMQLADEILGELRRTLEQRGVWDSATIIVSSDHHWRYRMWEHSRPRNVSWGPEDIPPTGERIPFMIKLPNQHSEVDYAPHVNTLITRELIDQLLKDPGMSTAKLVGWIEANRNRFDFGPVGSE
ncbi:MAG: sulfatase-like hydrolase/transferase [Acidobacteriaceae bacterium]